MKTAIYKTAEEFLKRKDVRGNGVSPEFAHDNPDWEILNERNEGCWNCLNCTDCIDCNTCINCLICSYCVSCIDCVGCSNCANRVNQQFRHIIR